MDNITSSLLAFLLSGLLWFLLTRKLSANNKEQIARQETANRELEKAIHVKERDFLAEKNKIDIAFSERLRDDRAASFIEGREAGLAEREKDHLIQVTNLKFDFQSTMAAERDKSELAHAIELKKETEAAHRAGKEIGHADREREHELAIANIRLDYSNSLAATRDEAVAVAVRKARAEFELQTKMFSVSIRPYVKVTRNDGFFSNDFETESGYQYQLLVNGIPAFKPHIIVESNQKQSKFKEENIQMLLVEARKAAEVAVQLYMGGSGQFVRYAPDLVERAVK